MGRQMRRTFVKTRVLLKQYYRSADKGNISTYLCWIFIDILRSLKGEDEERVRAFQYLVKGQSNSAWPCKGEIRRYFSSQTV